MSNIRFPLPSSPNSYLFSRDESLALIEDLGTPWHPRKCGREFLDLMVFIGFQWDLHLRTVSLPEAKRLKFLARVSDLLGKRGRKVPQLDLQKVHGSLVHVAFVYIHGTSHLPAFSNAVARYPNEFATRYLSEKVVKALEWWKRELSKPGIFRQLTPLPPLQDLHIFVDASTSWGIGILIGDWWYAFQLRAGWKHAGSSPRDICWLEAVALELLIYFLDQLGHSDCYLLMHSDNNGAIGAHSKGRSSNDEINLCVRRTQTVELERRITPSFIYVESALNPADAISRGIFPSRMSHLSRTFALPHDIANAIVDS